MSPKAKFDTDRQSAIIAGIRRGLADVATGRVTDHEQAVDCVDALVAKARKRKA